MIDFVKEIEKYQPILKVSDVPDSINDDEVHDIIDLLEDIVKNMKNVKKSGEEGKDN